jgi:hypothetical protein
MATLADLLTSKIPPHNLEAERAILGALLLEHAAWPRILERLAATDFYKEAHRRIFAAMARIHVAGVDVVTLSEALRQGAELEEIGGPAYLGTLLEEAGILPQLDSYAAIVREKAELRDLIRLGVDLIGRAYENGQSAAELLITGARELEALVRRASPRRAAMLALPALLATPPARPLWLVEGLIRQASNGWVGAGAKVGKSYLVLDLLLACALGAPWLDTFAIPRPLSIALVEEEDSAWRVYERATRLLRGRGVEAPRTFVLAVRSGIQLDKEASLAPLLDHLRASPVDLIVWDVFNKLHTVDEKRPEQTLPLLRRLDRLRDEFGVANLVLHHSRKPSVSGPDLASGGQQLRGPSEYWGWAENSLYLKPLKGKGVLVVEPESKDSLQGQFKVHLEDLGGDTRRWVYDGEVAAKVAEGDKTRELILEALSLNPMTVGQVADHTRKNEKTIKRHLGALEQDGAVEYVREPGSAGRKLWMVRAKLEPEAEELPF